MESTTENEITEFALKGGKEFIKPSLKVYNQQRKKSVSWYRIRIEDIKRESKREIDTLLKKLKEARENKQMRIAREKHQIRVNLTPMTQVEFDKYASEVEARLREGYTSMMEYQKRREESKVKEVA